MQRRLHGVYAQLLDNYVLIGDYGKALGVIKEIGESIGLKEKLLRMVVNLRCGWAYKRMLCLYLNLKYRVFKKKLA